MTNGVPRRACFAVKCAIDTVPHEWTTLTVMTPFSSCGNEGTNEKGKRGEKVSYGPRWRWYNNEGINSKKEQRSATEIAQ